MSDNVRVSDLVVLAGSADKGRAVLDRYYGWRHERATSSAKGLASAAAALLTAWLIPYLKGDFGYTSSALVIAVPTSLIAALAISAMWITRRLTVTHRTYLVACELVEVL
jgi:hypothetical protein